MGLQGVQSSQWDQLFEEIAAGRAFVAGNFSTGNAGQFGSIQLFNPAGSGKNVHVIQAWVCNPSGATVKMYFGTSAAALLLYNGRNLAVGGALSAAELRKNVTGALPGTLNIEMLTPAQELTPVFDRWGPQLGPGEAMQFASSVVAQTTYAHWQWIENEA